MSKKKWPNSQAMLKATGDLAQQVGADMVLLVADSGISRAAVQALNGVCETLVVTGSTRFLKGIEETGVRRVRFDFDVDGLAHFERVRQGIILGVEGGYIRKGSRLVCLSSVMERRGADALVVVDTGRGFEDFRPESVAALAGDLSVEVVKAVLDVAVDIGQEGREGEPVGTLFVIGDSERVTANSRPMTFDPFRGYSEREKNICNVDIRDGVKEVALMDGAFIVQADGVILSGGRYITADVKGLSLPKGLGARHVAAAAITNHTKAIAVVVSESTGTVRAFRRGQIVLRRVPPRRHLRQSGGG
jgi:DNA integrity scanning protein DisA with diadenylate cyclase activity